MNTKVWDWILSKWGALAFIFMMFVPILIYIVTDSGKMPLAGVFRILVERRLP